ncbi:MAG: helix-turn-helix domain-containing protein [Deltaproteobacteria bacterium]|nr:helix-turn-helix domain-containing protein [Deltaproteobacteria bacterium]
MSEPGASLLDGVLDVLVERIAERAATLVVERLQQAGEHPQPAEDTRLLDPKAVAAKLEVPLGAVYKMSASGKLPAVKVGGRLRFRLSDIELFIVQGTRSEDRVRELAAAVQADAGRARCWARRAPAPRRARAPGPARPADGSGRPATSEPGLKVLTNNDPDTAHPRRRGG